MKRHMGWEGVLFSAWFICCTATLKASPCKIQQCGFDWKKGSAVDGWVHLFSLHAAVIMFIRGVTCSPAAVLE